jgi:pyruvate dehydrogenase (quinone)
LPDEEDLRAAAQVLNAGKKVAIMAGQGALAATSELEEAAEILAAPIVKPLLGKAAVPDDSPYTTGSIGLLGTKPSQEAIEECDTLLMVGTSFPYIDSSPSQARPAGSDRRRSDTHGLALSGGSRPRRRQPAHLEKTFALA